MPFFHTPPAGQKRGLGTEAAKVLRTVQLRPRHPATVKEKGELLIRKRALELAFGLGKERKAQAAIVSSFAGSVCMGHRHCRHYCMSSAKGQKRLVYTYIGRRRRKEEIASH